MVHFISYPGDRILHPAKIAGVVGRGAYLLSSQIPFYACLFRDMLKIDERIVIYNEQVVRKSSCVVIQLYKFREGRDKSLLRAQPTYTDWPCLLAIETWQTHFVSTML